MKTKQSIFFIGALITFSAMLFTACGGSATPAPNPNDSQARVVLAATAEPVAEATTDVTALATDVARVQNPPTPVPEGTVTPGAQVTFNRKFRYGSLNGTLLGWQIVPGDGITCQAVSDANLALRVHLENTASKPYWIGSDSAHVLGPNDEPANTLYDGAVWMGKGGGESILQIPENTAVDQTFCTGLTAHDDPNQMTLVLGIKEFTQARVPLAAQGAADMGGYAESELTKTFTYKGAEFTLPKLILTTGVWSDQSGAGQAQNGKLWLLLPTEVNNTDNANLFIEKGEVSLAADGQTLNPALDFTQLYQAAPYGLEKGKTAQGAFLFEIPNDAKQATLHLKSSDSAYPDDVRVQFDSPASH